MRRLLFVVLIFVCASFAQNAGEPVDAPGWINRGVQAFKSAKYDEAITAFHHAADLDPANVDAHLYLGTSYFVQYVPGIIVPENLAFAEKAREQFEEVLRLQAQNKPAIQSLASLTCALPETQCWGSRAWA